VTPEDTFHRLLGLGEAWKVISTHYEEPKNTFVIAVEETPQLWEQERRRLEQKVTCYDHVEPMQWRHLNVFNKECVIVCALPRGLRALDKKVYRVPPPWEGRSKHFTQEFEAFALTLMKEMPVKKAGEILGETDQRLWRMLFAQVEEAHRRMTMEDLVWVGADEMNRKKGHNYITVFADLREKRVVFATEGKDAEVWDEFALEIGKHDGHHKAITQVAIDMSRAYIKGVKENLPNAEIVFDKFHVISAASEGLDKVRILETQASEANRSVLSKSLWLWRKNPENLTDQQVERLEGMDWKHLLTAKAYQMRLALRDIYAVRQVDKAREQFGLWCEWVKREAAKKGQDLLQPMVKVAAMIESHLEGILGHWKDGLTTAFMEGLNSLFSATKRKARGFRSTRYLITMLYFVAGKLKIPCPSIPLK
jgi:transposase